MNCCSKSDATKDSIGCQAEYAGGTLEIFTTVEGERPGAMSGLSREGIQHERETVNLCILRGQHWAFRRGRVELSWRPNMEDMRTGRGREDVKTVMQTFNTNTDEL